MASTEMDWWLNLQPPAVKKGLTVVTREEAGPLLHMSIDGNIKRFTPYVTRRTGNNENISVPRVSVATSILGCFIGYCMAFEDVFWPDLRNKAFKNGWYVYDLPYTEALKPNPKQLFDQEMSDEHWLITYSEQTRTYAGVIKAKMFFSEIILKPVVGKQPRRSVKLLVEVMSDQMVFAENMVLDKGYWEITGPDPMFVDDWRAGKEYTVRKLSGGEWAAAKKLTADMLSLAPPAFGW